MEHVVVLGVVLAMTLLFSALTAPAVFAPLMQGKPSDRVRYYLVDVVVLVVHLQITWAAVLLEDERPLHVLMAGVVAAVWWWWGVRLLGRSGVQRNVTRLWFLALLNPLGHLAALLLLFWLPVALLILPTAWLGGGAGDLQALVLALAALAVAALEVLLVVACHHGCRLIAREARRESGETEYD